MIDIVLKIIKIYIETGRKPTIDDLEIIDNNLLANRGNIFVTLFNGGEVCGSSGNIKEIEENIVKELIENTIGAIDDERFKKLNTVEAESVKIRIDIIISREVLDEENISNLNPTNDGVLVIKQTHDKLAVVLPNISTILTSGKDFIPILEEKLGEKFIEENYIIYKISTKKETNY